ncbi:MAG: YqiA/YcfP family alpha/beta fold hydrolase [Myxococcota bacterium]
MRYAYLHGFASSSKARKGVALRERFLTAGIELELPDLNRPAFAELSHGAILAFLDQLFGADPVRLIGSSFGGWLAARWAELHPTQVDRLLLLCPGFHLAERWPALFGAEAMAAWQRTGGHLVEDAAGVPTRLHYGFYEESLRQPASPAVPCPTHIVHGVRDEVVPIEGSRRYAAEHRSVRLIEVDDDHSLIASIDRVADAAHTIFEFPSSAAS